MQLAPYLAGRSGAVAQAQRSQLRSTIQRVQGPSGELRPARCRNPQDTRHQEVAVGPSTVPSAVHAGQRVMAEPGRAVVRRADPEEARGVLQAFVCCSSFVTAAVGRGPACAGSRVVRSGTLG